MEKVYTLAEVIEHLGFGEVAIKIKGIEKVERDIGCFKISSIGQAIHYDENDSGVLKFVNGKDLYIAKFEEENEHNKEKFIIVTREIYNKIKENIMQLSI